ncbi:MAG TPA: nuclear transport factor 2 family protein [Actinomycetota bacterium]|jgi:ketosteroid isomerase-like protein
MDTREVIDRYYETVNAGDWDTWLTLFADDLVVDEQLAGHLEGVAPLRGAVGAMKKGYSKFLMLPEHVVIEAEQAAVVWHCEAANASGVPIDVRGANYFRVEEGKIVYMANFHDKGAFAPFTSQKLD